MDDRTPFDPDEPGDAETAAASSQIDYRALIQEALRSVPRQVLRQVAEHGLPGAHHFFVDFRTDHAGVDMPATLRSQFETSMRIVLQNQFWNLEVDDDAFEVDLRFSGVYMRLRVPFDAVTAFVDPAAELALAFDASALADGDLPEPAAPEAGAAGAEAPDVEAGAADAEAAEKGDAAGGAVVSLDAFRKRDR